MAEYIEREALRQEIERIYQKHFVKSREKFVQDTFKAMFKRIGNAPAADVSPVVHGRWEESVEIQTDTSTLYDYTCSVCSIVTARESPYCPNCGARMDGE